MYSNEDPSRDVDPNQYHLGYLSKEANNKTRLLNRTESHVNRAASGHAESPFSKMVGRSQSTISIESPFSKMVGGNQSDNNWNGKQSERSKKSEFNNRSGSGGGSALEPFDLSVNHLQVIPFWDGSLASGESVATSEDFLPIVASAEDIDLRFRLRPIPTSNPNYVDAIRGISAYQIIAETAHDPHKPIWNSDKVAVEEDEQGNRLTPPFIEWDERRATLSVGSIVRWKVLVWDGLGQGPTSSEWSKFAMGPSSRRWEAKWITHPTDYATLFDSSGIPRKRVIQPRGNPPEPQNCTAWKQRLPLPLARVQFKVLNRQEVSSALLVASGLGVFSVSMNGKRLSSSSVQDPPLTDFAQRVSYRGFDITDEIRKQAKQEQQHAIGITLGSGWWDPRPINSAVVSLDFMTHGSLTTIAQLHVTYQNGTRCVLIPTGGGDSNDSEQWMFGKGPLLESSLYMGERVDLERMQVNQGWDTVNMPVTSSIDWVVPTLYDGSGKLHDWRRKLHNVALFQKRDNQSAVGPIGKLVPLEMPPVLPVDKIAPVSTVDLGSGRWLFDFGRGMSGLLRFEKGLPQPMEPAIYPRAHNLSMTLKDDQDKYISVVYGDSRELTTGDINLALVAGFGFHAGGERASRPKNTLERAGPCFPPEDLVGYEALTQRDVYVVPTGASMDLFRHARQPYFSVHGFQFAEVCCSQHPPSDVYAIQYRTAYQTWGSFESSNPVFNGGEFPNFAFFLCLKFYVLDLTLLSWNEFTCAAYEMTRNALESNTVGQQSDCPHRERTQYGGDIISTSPAAMHMFDMSAFYRKVVHDWTDSQFANGAYPVTSTFQDLLRFASLTGHGGGETVWASVAPILTARHMRHYGDLKLAVGTLHNHVKWLEFLSKHWNSGTQIVFGDISEYDGGGKGLGDWLALMGRDTWITHNAFYLASARCVAYLAKRILDISGSLEDARTGHTPYLFFVEEATNLASQIEQSITKVYKGDTFTYKAENQSIHRLGQDLGLYTRMMDGSKRCPTLRHWLKAIGGNGMYGTLAMREEALFNQLLNKAEYIAMEAEGHIRQVSANRTLPLYRMRYALMTGLFGIKYSLKTLSDNGFHSLGLTKASGSYMPSFGLMLSFNATTLWETFGRSEDVYSRNHPMMGAIAEWLAESVAGISLSPTTVAGKDLLFWPRISSTNESAHIIHQASATQGTKSGTAAIAWKLLNSTTVRKRSGRGTQQIAHAVIRILVPPGSRAGIRLPSSVVSEVDMPKSPPWKIQQAASFPDLEKAQLKAHLECEQRREKKDGFPFHWHFDQTKHEFYRVYEKKAIGTPCESFLFHVEPTSWQDYRSVKPSYKQLGSSSTSLPPGLYEITMDGWVLQNDVPKYGYWNYLGTLGPYCSDGSTFDWNIDDAEHII